MGAQSPDVHGAILSALGLPALPKPLALQAKDAGPIPAASGLNTADPAHPAHGTALAQAIPVPHVATGTGAPEHVQGRRQDRAGHTVDHATARAQAAEAAIQRLEAGSQAADPTEPEASRTSLRSVISVATDTMEDDRDGALPKRTRSDRSPGHDRKSSINMDKSTTPAAKQTTKPPAASSPSSPRNLARALEDEMVLQTSSNTDQLKALERQLADYKDVLDKFMTHGAPKPASKRAPKVAAAKKAHEVGVLNLPARQTLTKSLRYPNEGEAVFAIKPPVTKDSYLYVHGTIASVEGVYVYVSITPDIRIEGASLDPEIEVYDRNWIFASEAHVKEAILRLSELIDVPLSSGTSS